MSELRVDSVLRQRAELLERVRQTCAQVGFPIDHIEQTSIGGPMTAVDAYGNLLATVRERWDLFAKTWEADVQYSNEIATALSQPEART